MAGRRRQRRQQCGYTATGRDGGQCPCCCCYDYWQHLSSALLSVRVPSCRRVTQALPCADWDGPQVAYQWLLRSSAGSGPSQAGSYNVDDGSDVS